MLKRVVGAKIDDLDPAVVTYLEDMIKEAVEDDSKREELQQALCDFVPDWSMSEVDFNTAMLRIREPDVQSLEESDRSTDSEADVSTSHSNTCAQTNITGADTSSTRMLNGMQRMRANSSPQKGFQHGKSSTKDKAASKSHKSSLCNADSFSQLIGTFLQGLEIEDSVDAVMIEYFDKALLEFFKSARTTSFPTDDNRAELIDMFMGYVPNIRLLDSTIIDDFLRNSMRIYQKSLHRKSHLQSTPPSVASESSQQQYISNNPASGASTGPSEEDSWKNASADVLTLREIFPGVSRSEFETQLRGVPLEQVIEKLMQTFELQSLSASLSAERQAQAKAFEQEALEAAKRRALARYDKVEDYGKIEGGKRINVSKIVTSKSADLEEAIKSTFGSKMPKERYINNQVVTHKGERFILEKKGVQSPQAQR